MYFPFDCLQWTQAACNSATPISQAYEGECVYEGEGILKTNTNIYCCTNLFSTECPTEQPEFGSACSLPQFAKCSYGEECCCGQCHPRFIWTKFWSMLIQMPPQVRSILNKPHSESVAIHIPHSHRVENHTQIIHLVSMLLKCGRWHPKLYF